MTIYCRTFNQ